MNEPILNDEAKKVFDKVLTIWPAMVQKARREKILSVLAGMMATKGVSEAGADLVIAATKFVAPKSFDAIFMMWEDMDAFKRLTIDTYDDMEAYYARPIRVRRWERADTAKPSKPPEQMKVLAFCASPRRSGNTAILVEEALKGAMSTGAQGEKIMLQKIKLGYCIGCRRCKDADFERMCAVKDDMTEIYNKIIESDAIIIGFPVYTGRECAQLSTFFDRWDCFARYKFQDKLEPGRRGMVIGTWGFPTMESYDDIVENVMLVLKFHKIETVEALSASGFEGMLHGLDDNRKGVIAQHPEELKKAYEAGIGLVTL
jgi:multimeric flavodoxin WrbA